MRFIYSLSLLLCLSISLAGAPPIPPRVPVSPQDSLKYIQLDAALKIELVAHEPEVVDPIAIRFDEHERLWVVEMRDYPLGPPSGQPPLSRIRILEDANHDGRYENAKIFAEHLPFITGVQPWRGGAFVTLAGKVAYLKDTDGDGRADINETWFTGFAEENSQLRANHPRLALDGWIYVANGLRGGSVVDARQSNAKPLSISGRDFRFHPLTGEYEAISGAGQFGMTFDEAGRRFICSNRHPMMHVVLEDRYLKRNPAFAVPAIHQDVAKSAEFSRVFALSRAWTTSNLHAGQFTAACGVKIFGGDALPREYVGNGFTCDPTGNLMHREVMSSMGGSFESKSPYADREFLASTDEWFRPVNSETGPDGAFYVVDMYRAVIEHPQFVPDELKNRPDQRDGDDRGRLYRITAKNWQTPQGRIPLARATPEKWLESLGSSNAWTRDTAARLILENPERITAPQLETTFSQGNHYAKLHSLWLMRNLKRLPEGLLEKAMRDSSPIVRETAAIVSEGTLEKGSALRKQLLALAHDPDPRVRFQAALSLTPGEANETAELREILAKNIQDVWTRRAVAIAAGNHAAEVAIGLLQNAKSSPAMIQREQAAAWTELVAMVATSKDEKSLQSLFEFLLTINNQQNHVWLQRAGLIVVAQSLAKQGSSLSKKVEQLPSAEIKTTFESLASQELTSAENVKLAPERRIEAIDLLAFLPHAKETIAKLAIADPEQAVRIKAIAALGRNGNNEAWKKLVTGFRREAPATRKAILEGMLTSRERTGLLLDEIANGTLKVNELDRLQQDRLLKHSDVQLRERAKQLLASAIPADREKILAEYQIVFTLPDDPVRGKAVFAKNCAGCHRVGDLGVNVAPDISDSRVKQPQQILTDILQPNRAIDNNYVSYLLATNDGRTFVGLLTTETAGSVTMRQPENKTLTFLRSEIEEIQSTGQSLMPEGLEKNIPPADMADLISFIKNWRYLDGKTPFDKKKP